MCDVVNDGGQVQGKISNAVCVLYSGDCESGRFIDDSGKCQPCDVGHYCRNGDRTKCPADRYSDTALASACKECQANSGTGEKTGATAASACACKPGFYRKSGAAAGTACLPCRVGYACIDGSETPCGTNSFQHRPQQSNCLTCPANSAHDLTGQTDVEACICKAGYHMQHGQCLSCPYGHMCAGRGEAALPCPGDTYQDQAGASECKRCPVGSGHDGKGARHLSSCRCGAGSYLDPETSSCLLCPAGSKCPHGLLVACPHDASNNGQGSTECQTCERKAGDLPESLCFSTSTQCCADFMFESECIKSCPVGTWGDKTTKRCRKCSVCEAGRTWQAKSCSESADTECRAFANCRAGTYRLRDGTPTSDTECAPCSSGTFSTSTNAATCKAWRTCAPGTYEVAAPSAAVDRQCAPCPSGEFSDTTNARACRVATACEPGTRVASAPTQTTDRVCSPCPSGQYSDAPNAATCSSYSDCNAGYFQAAPLSPAANRRCETCELGSTFQPLRNQRTCRPLTICGAGLEEATSPTLISDRSCTACEAGVTFSAAVDSPCTAVRQPCTLGVEYEVSAATVAKDRECAAVTLSCGAGTEEVGQPTATRDRVCRRCAPGTYELSGLCTACASGTWQDEQGATNCKTHIAPLCNATDYQYIAPSTTSDRVCRPISPPCDGAREIQIIAPSNTRDRECAPRNADGTSQGNNVAAGSETGDSSENATSGGDMGGYIGLGVVAGLVAIVAAVMYAKARQRTTRKLHNDSMPESLVKGSIVVNEAFVNNFSPGQSAPGLSGRSATGPRGTAMALPEPDPAEYMELDVVPSHQQQQQQVVMEDDLLYDDTPAVSHGFNNVSTNGLPDFEEPETYEVIGPEGADSASLPPAAGGTPLRRLPTAMYGQVVGEYQVDALTSSPLARQESYGQVTDEYLVGPSGQRLEVDQENYVVPSLSNGYNNNSSQSLHGVSNPGYCGTMRAGDTERYGFDLVNSSSASNNAPAMPLPPRGARQQQPSLSPSHKPAERPTMGGAAGTTTSMCSHVSQGRPCQTAALPGGFLCRFHKCPVPGCRNSKSSRESACSQHSSAVA